jgi:hypothetical protein
MSFISYGVVLTREEQVQYLFKQFGITGEITNESVIELIKKYENHDDAVVYGAETLNDNIDYLLHELDIDSSMEPLNTCYCEHNGDKFIGAVSVIYKDEYDTFMELNADTLAGKHTLVKSTPSNVCFIDNDGKKRRRHNVVTKTVEEWLAAAGITKPCKYYIM